jgi:hypothetical protein
MLDEENDKTIKEAAEHYHPEYDDTAWDKMEHLLDEHLPVEKDRKRFLLLIPLLLFTGCFLFLFLYNPATKTEAPEIVVSSNKTEKAIDKNSGNISTPKTSSASIKNPAIGNKGNKPIENDHINSVDGKSEKPKPVASSATTGNQNEISASENDISYKQNTNKSTGRNIGDSSNPEKTIHPDEPDRSTFSKESNKPGEKKSLSEKDTLSKNNISKSDKLLPGKISKKAKTSSSGFANNFGVSVSAGPDVSDVYHNTIGKLTMAYGVGLSYDISKKLSIRTGFYLSKKIYSVGADDYKMPAGTIGNYEYLQNVEANCKVYEIPVKVDYNFRKIKNHNWFVSAGLSSYLMKKETYDYYYKTPGGELYNKDWSISNKNKHFFSVLDISGGYVYSFNPRISLAAEPYLNLPLTGIGAGKVKLNSGGILFTLKAKPFKGKTK